jgi:hypothetical protein
MTVLKKNDNKTNKLRIFLPIKHKNSLFRGILTITHRFDKFCCDLRYDCIAKRMEDRCAVLYPMSQQGNSKTGQGFYIRYGIVKFHDCQIISKAAIRNCIDHFYILILGSQHYD